MSWYTTIVQEKTSQSHMRILSQASTNCLMCQWMPKADRDNHRYKNMYSQRSSIYRSCIEYTITHTRTCTPSLRRLQALQCVEYTQRHVSLLTVCLPPCMGLGRRSVWRSCLVYMIGFQRQGHPIAQEIHIHNTQDNWSEDIIAKMHQGLCKLLCPPNIRWTICKSSWKTLTTCMNDAQVKASQTLTQASTNFNHSRNTSQGTVPIKVTRRDWLTCNGRLPQTSAFRPGTDWPGCIAWPLRSPSDGHS